MEEESRLKVINSSLKLLISYIFSDISSCSESDTKPDDKENKYRYSILVVPPSATIPYWLLSDKKISPHIRRNLNAISWRPRFSEPAIPVQNLTTHVVFDTSHDAATLFSNLFKNTEVSLPLHKAYKEFPVLKNSIKKWGSELSKIKQILVVTPPLGRP